MLKVNVRGVFLAIQAAAAHLSDGGRIITVGSNTAVRSGYPGSSVYAMTKAAVAVMVKGIAVDLAPRGITVNNIQPGPTLTDMTAGYIDSITPAIPLKRVGISSAGNTGSALLRVWLCGRKPCLEMMVIWPL